MSSFAYLDPKLKEWLYCDTGYHWPVMVVTKASAAN